jgi:hypothetical protein
MESRGRRSVAKGWQDPVSPTRRDAQTADNGWPQSWAWRAQALTSRRRGLTDRMVGDDPSGREAEGE